MPINAVRIMIKLTGTRGVCSLLHCKLHHCFTWHHLFLEISGQIKITIVMYFFDKLIIWHCDGAEMEM